MPTTQEKPPFHHRFSGNILSRMLQLEKQSKQNRIISSQTTIFNEEKPIAFTTFIPQSLALSPHTALSSHPLPSRMPRSNTTPNLLSDTKGLGLDQSAPKDADAGIMMDDKEDDNSEICLSPSWSEFGNRKKKDRKKIERERKENERKQKKDLEQQKAAESKAGKRLSKRPPAAMDTQKMSSTLRRNSGQSLVSQSPAQENSRRSSQEEKRFSGASTNSKDRSRSQSTAGTSTTFSQGTQGNNGSKSSSEAPQIPKMRNFSWHSRHSSGNSSNGDPAYEDALANFAHHLRDSALMSDLQKSPTVLDNDYRPQTQPIQGQQLIKDHRPLSQPIQSQHMNSPFVRSQTTPEFGLNQRQNSNGKSMGSAPPTECLNSTDIRLFQEQINTNASHRQQNLVQRMSDETPIANSEKRGASDDPPPASRLNNGSSAHKAQPLQIKTHYDGSSYVHKQRMYQQQRSIAGFQDELAIRDANEANYGSEFVEGRDPSSIPSRSVSSESSKPPTRQTSIECDCKPENSSSQPEPHDQYHESKKESKNAVVDQPINQSPIVEHSVTETPIIEHSVIEQSHATPSSKTDRILSFRRFQKKGKQTNASTPPKPGLPTSRSSVNSVPALQPSMNAPALIPIKTSSKVERILGESMLTPADTGSDTSEKDPPKNDPEKSAVQNHSRRKTSSSQLLNDNLSLRPLPRSSTTPVLPMIDKVSRFSQLVDEKIDLQASKPSEPPSPERLAPLGPRDPPHDTKAPQKTSPEIVIEGVTGEGLVHKTSIKRPRSNPMLQTAAAPPNQLPSLDFLPQLRHQPLTKPKRTPIVRPTSSIVPAFPASPPLPAHPPPAAKSSSEPHLPSINIPDIKSPPRSPLRPQYHQPRPETSLVRPGQSSRRRTMDPTGALSAFRPLSFGKAGTADGIEPKPIAKLFVICCKCKFWHDLPSKMYELMALPQKLRRDENAETSSQALGKINEATLDTMVKCPWCDHYMTTWCCAGWTTVVYLHERHH